MPEKGDFILNFNNMIIILSGVSGSGKTTLATELCNTNEKTVRVNRDNLREGLVGTLKGYYQRKDLNVLEKQVTWLQNAQIRHLLQHGYNVIIDNTHCKESYINEILNEFQHLTDIKLFFKDCTLEECIKRVKNRECPGFWNWSKRALFDTNYIKKQYNDYKKLQIKYPEKQYVFPQTNCKYIPPIQAPRCIICDLDGTLCLYDNKNAYDRDFENDRCNNAVREVLINYQQSNPTNTIFFFSGRKNKFRGQTLEFIQKHFPKSFSYSLCMRNDKDDRKDTTIKKEMFDNFIAGQYSIDFVIDDRLCVIRQYEKMGIPVFNVNVGNKEF